MDKPHEEAAGYKHRSMDKFMNAFKKTVMDIYASIAKFNKSSRFFIKFVPVRYEIPLSK